MKPVTPAEARYLAAGVGSRHDVDVARDLGVTSVAVCLFRKRHGIPRYETTHAKVVKLAEARKCSLHEVLMDIVDDWLNLGRELPPRAERK